MMDGRRRGHARAFTLIELLVVMAISVILIGLIFGPLVQGFNLTQRARVQVLTQDTARRAIEQGVADLSDAVYVFDNSSQPLNFWVHGSASPVQLPYACIDLVPPMRNIDQYIDPQTNKLWLLGHPEFMDPTTGAVLDTPLLRRRLRESYPNLQWLADTALPVAPGRTVVRYFLGLRDPGAQSDPSNKTSGRPLKPYANYYADVRNLSMGDHNPYVLYRAVVSPYRYDERTGQFVANDYFFNVTNGVPKVFDSNFFYDMTVVTAVSGWRDLNGDGKANRGENWKAIARPVVPTDRADEVIAPLDDNGHPVYTKITPLVRLQPTAVSSDAPAPSSLTDVENDAPADLPPSAYVSTYGHWGGGATLAVTRNSTTLDWTMGGAATDLVKYGGGSHTWDPTNPQQVVYAGDFKSGDSTLLFLVDSEKGRVDFALPDSMFARTSSGWSAVEYDPQLINAAYSSQAGAGMDNMSALAPPNAAYHLISLKSSPVDDTGTSLGEEMPLATIPNVRLVPGSEVVMGPDMIPGPHYGWSTHYTRSSTSDPSALRANEYMIRYADETAAPGTPSAMDAALLSMGTIIFRSGFDVPGNPGKDAPRFVNQDDPRMFKNAADRKFANHGLPNFKFNPSTGLLDTAADPVTVTYKLQNNKRTDNVRLAYLTREQLTISIGVRLYEFNSGQPQQVTLTRKVLVKNTPR